MRKCSAAHKRWPKLELYENFTKSLSWLFKIYSPAPESGYVPDFQFDVLPSTGRGPNGTWDWSKRFYVVARNGSVYAGLKVDFVGGKLWFGFNGYLNPDGTRNLQPDPQKVATDPKIIQQIDEALRPK